MRGTIPYTQLPEFDLGELSLMQLALISNDLAAALDNAPPDGTVNHALQTFRDGLFAAIRARPISEFAGALDFAFAAMDLGEKRCTAPASHFQLAHDRSVLAHLRFVLLSQDL